ncbi:MAG: DUF1538 domain-containing protein [Desulfobacteraceae bacterium]|nr:MAG: DUF1538 domain-containing protein [Desulfobacteraceae bacterium]
MSLSKAMKSHAVNQEKIKLSPRQFISILLPYARNRIVEQVKSVALIIVYLFFFQTVILQMEIVEASTIAAGLAIVIGGLAFFMEGLLLGLMPLGEAIGLKLPQKANAVTISVFAFVLGVGATFAEPAIGILKTAGETVKPWEAPLLFMMLNKYPQYLVYAVGIGVGMAVVFGMLRYLYNWSLKPFIYILTGLLVVVTGWANWDPNLSAIIGLAWDCGAVTTGPVTVPLVLALGIGVCRMATRGGAESSGFGVVTLASLFPVITVFVLGAVLQQGIPSPMMQEEFYKPENRQKVLRLFDSKDEFMGYTFKHLGAAQQLALFDGNVEEMLNLLRTITTDKEKRFAVFGSDLKVVHQWALTKGTEEQRAAVFGPKMIVENPEERSEKENVLDFIDVFSRNMTLALQAIIPLVAFLLVVLVFFLRERLPRTDEVFLGVLFALVGMTMFNVGIELGLAKLGSQVGSRLPSSFKEVELPEKKQVIRNFDLEMVQKAIDEKGQEHRFFFFRDGSRIDAFPYDDRVYDPKSKSYVHIPRKGPMFGDSYMGVAFILFFAFAMGYGATLAEPALNALGISVEEITVGTFKKGLLMHSVAVGVGAGLALGVVKIIYGVSLFWLLAPPYLLLLLLTWSSTEEFVSIGWDSAGVTTGPVTVPLVLALGLGIGNQVGVVEGFGILAMASVCPILSVLFIGLRVKKQQEVNLKEPGPGLQDKGVEK